MNTKKKPEGAAAFVKGGLSAKRKKALRRQLMEHAIFEKMMQMSMPEMVSEKAEGSHLDEETLGGFLENRLSPDKREDVKLHLRTCMECFVKMAKLQRKLQEEKKLQYAQAPSEFIEKAKQLVAIPVVDETEIASSPRSESASRWQRLVNKTREIWPEIVSNFDRIGAWPKRHPVWSAASAGLALATIILFTLLLPKPAVENFVENRLVIMDDGPLGFTTGREVREYEGMSVRLSEDGENLIFQWAGIPEAISFDVLLTGGGKTQKLPFSKVVKGASFSLSKKEVELDLKYTWELRGKLKDGRSFAAKAGFVRRR